MGNGNLSKYFRCTALLVLLVSFPFSPAEAAEETAENKNPEIKNCALSLQDLKFAKLTSSLARRFISNIQRAKRNLEADAHTVPEHLVLLRKSFHARSGYVFDVNHGSFRMQGMMVQKNNVMEATVVRIGVWDQRRKDFLNDGEIPKDMGLKSGALFMKFSEALILWAMELRKDDPTIDTLRIDAMSIRNPVLIPLLKALEFQHWPQDEKNLRLDVSFSQLKDG